MKGVICRRHVIAHPLTTIQSFGWTVFFRALTAGPDRTFLSIVAPTLFEEPPPPAVSSLIERCVGLEVRAAAIYRRLAGKHGDTPPLASFFETLARHEQGHAELLELCRGLAGESSWEEKDLERWLSVLPRLEDRMTEVEKNLEDLVETSDVLNLVIDIEGSEINQLFHGVVSATKNDFVQTFDAFRNAEKEHLDFICSEIPRLEVDLAGACADLRAAHP